MKGDKEKQNGNEWQLRCCASLWEGGREGGSEKDKKALMGGDQREEDGIGHWRGQLLTSTSYYMCLF